MTVSQIEVGAEVEDLVQRAPWPVLLMDMIRRKPLGAAGAFIVVFFILIAAFANVIAPYDPTANAFDRMHMAPGAEHWFGTDQFGRDLMSRLIYGARTALFVGFVAAFVGSTLGLVLGVASAYFGGLFDLVLQRIMDVFMAFPLIIMALAVVAILGSGIQNVIIAITIPFIPPLCPGGALQRPIGPRNPLYRCGARLRIRPQPDHPAPHGAERDGALPDHADRVRRPGDPAGSLAFLSRPRRAGTDAGLGSDAAGRRREEYAESAPWIAIFPGLAITLAVFAFNLFGDAVRDALDPKLRSQ